MAADASDDTINNDSDSQAPTRKKLSFITIIFPPKIVGSGRWAVLVSSPPTAHYPLPTFLVSVRRLFQTKRDGDFLVTGGGPFEPLFHLRFQNLGLISLSLFHDLLEKYLLPVLVKDQLGGRPGILLLLLNSQKKGGRFSVVATDFHQTRSRVQHGDGVGAGRQLHISDVKAKGNFTLEPFHDLRLRDARARADHQRQYHSYCLQLFFHNPLLLDS